MAVPKVTWPQVMSWRLRRHLLARADSKIDEVELARRVSGLHAQLASAAELAAWVRTRKISGEQLPAAVLLLPPFDPFVIGVLRHLDRVTDPAMRGRISRTSGWISATLVVAGRIAGTWTYDGGRNRVAVTVTPFAPLGKTEQRAAERHATSYADAWGLPVDVTWDA